MLLTYRQLQLGMLLSHGNGAFFLVGDARALSLSLYMLVVVANTRILTIVHVSTSLN